MLRVSENPPPRWPEDRTLFDDLGDWWVARTRPRNEKALAWDLQKMNVGYYLPMMTKRTIRRDTGKPRKSVICLFPGYISLTGFADRKSEIFRTGRVLKVIEVLDQDRFVFELENVRRAVEAVKEASLHSRLAAGQKVIITSGPLQGVEGVVVKQDHPGRLYLNVEMFNQAVVVTVSPGQLMPADV